MPSDAYNVTVRERPSEPWLRWADVELNACEKRMYIERRPEVLDRPQRQPREAFGAALVADEHHRGMGELWTEPHLHHTVLAGELRHFDIADDDVWREEAQSVESGKAVARDGYFEANRFEAHAQKFPLSRIVSNDEHIRRNSWSREFHVFDNRDVEPAMSVETAYL